MSNQNFEETKWLIDRIDKILLAFKERMLVNEKEFHMESEKIIDSQREIQKGTLGLLGIVIALIVGIQFLQNFEIQLFITILVSFTLFFLGIFISSLVYEYYMSGLINPVKKAYSNEIAAIGAVRGNFLIKTTDLEKYTTKQFETYLGLVVFSGAALQFKVLVEYEKIINSRQGYKSLKSHTETKIELIKDALNSASKIYPNKIKEFEADEICEIAVKFVKDIQTYIDRNNNPKKN